ncbi:MAG: molybdenum cofactor biosynthesis protein MoaE [Thiohalomonadaceae bacterium]
MSITVTPAPFEPWETLRAHELQLARRAKVGACAVFVGTMRDINEGDGVRAMTLEHYPGMTERHLERIAAEAKARWSLEDVLVVHRVGEVTPADPIVLVAVWSGHRREAFEACRFIMEDLKSKAPFWKKEQLDTQARWVEHNTPGH